MVIMVSMHSVWRSMQPIALTGGALHASFKVLGKNAVQTVSDKEKR